MAQFYEEHNVQTIIIVGQDNAYNAATTAFAKSYAQKFNYDSPIRVVADPHFQKVGKAAYHWTTGSAGIPHFIVVDDLMTIHHTDSGIQGAAEALEKITGIGFDFSSL